MTDMPRCGTCKFWGEPDQYVQRFRECTAVKHGYTTWDNDGSPHMVDNALYDYGKGPEQDVRGAVAVDGSGYFAALKTEEDFGCTFHAPVP